MSDHEAQAPHRAAETESTTRRSLPRQLFGSIARWFRRLLGGMRALSPAARRVEEKERQAGVRRELRGLPPEHDQTAYRPPTDD